MATDDSDEGSIGPYSRTDTLGWETRWHAIRQLLGRKWSLHVLHRLADDDPLCFTDLETSLDGMTATMLSRRLSELRCAGLVDRQVEATSPPTTTYRLTAGGRQVAVALRGLGAATEHVECAPDACEDDACDEELAETACSPESPDCACIS
ncbi:winged helix-turn-helix transcriptional regulator [Haloarchaeobius amylolyticus]|uniref:winged helix-turn-helix transcriptional regulator n=1 Tax=Haloarchaeobius amylolyticus TaxID=1198296 RepID=UPI00226EC207|nr:helix-turn-helix domain-containing protein [Haloarchaeobius amylolyticus]